ncbi:MAG TPA: class IV adenylate cyclase [Pyrinomonadaceae bacterium]|nr:class IV adenylate cyclase [Pyrinomonadaceae bacterium]
MPIEIEKKYRLAKGLQQAIEKRLRDLGASSRPVEFEENTLYRGGRLDFGGCALRLRRVGDRAILTFKQRIPTDSAIKHQREEESVVADADAVSTILISLGFQPALVYEKRRTRWKLGKAVVVIDELPFGLFMEIEASEKEIARVEKMIGAERLPAVMETYPMLTVKLGKKRKGIIEARFKKMRRRKALLK